MEICAGLSAQTGFARVSGLCGLTFGLSRVGRSGDAIAIADDTMSAARSHANPLGIAYAYWGYGVAYIESDPHRALDTLREGLAYTRQHRIRSFEAYIAMDAAGVEAVHGDIDQALDLFTASIDSFHQAGNTASLLLMFAHLMWFFDRSGRPEITATFCGTTRNLATNQATGFAAAVDHARNMLDTDTFETGVRAGAAMTLTEAVHYAHHHIDNARQHHP